MPDHTYVGSGFAQAVASYSPPHDAGPRTRTPDQPSKSDICTHSICVSSQINSRNVLNAYAMLPRRLFFSILGFGVNVVQTSSFLESSSNSLNTSLARRKRLIWMEIRGLGHYESQCYRCQCNYYQKFRVVAQKSIFPKYWEFVNVPTYLLTCLSIIMNPYLPIFSMFSICSGVTKNLDVYGV